MLLVQPDEVCEPVHDRDGMRGDTFFTRPGRTFRILAINEGSDDVHAIWTVEPE